MEFIHIIYLIVGLVGAAYFYIRRTYGEFERNGIPFVKPVFPHGSGRGLMVTTPISTIMQKFYNELKSDGPFGGVFFLLRPVIIVTSLEFVKKVLIKDFTWFDERGSYYNKEDDPLSAHLFSLDGAEWRKLRSKLSPTFTSGKMKFMYPTIIEVSDRFKSVLNEQVGKDGKNVEVKELLARFTTDVIGTCAFGIECNSLTDPNANFLRMGRKIFTEPRHKPLIMGLIDSFKNISKLFRVKIISDDVSSFFMNLVQDTVEYREKNNIQRNDFMDILIRLKNEDHIDGDENMGRLTLNEVAAQAFVFFLAGFETSSTVMTFSLYELALNRELQEQARNEIKSIISKHDEKFTYDAVKSMTIVDQIINESLRKYPPLSMVNRSAVRDYYVPEYDYVIRKGTPIWIPVYGLHHDPELYPEPEKFDINRFSSENVQNREQASFLPFGDGPRNCVGLRFGMMQARVGLAQLILNFNFSVCDETNIPLKLAPEQFITSPVGGITLKVQAL